MMMIGMGFGAVIMVLFWAGLVALVVWLVGGLFPRGGRLAQPMEQNLDAGQILDRRYARGEITRGQFKQMKQTISEDAE